MLKPSVRTISCYKLKRTPDSIYLLSLIVNDALLVLFCPVVTQIKNKYAPEAQAHCDCRVPLKKGN